MLKMTVEPASAFQHLMLQELKPPGIRGRGGRVWERKRKLWHDEGAWLDTT